MAPLVPEFFNLLVTRTFSKTESLAGLRIGYALLPGDLADVLSASLRERNILVKPLSDKCLGAGYMRITISLPKNIARFLAALQELL